MRRSAFSSYPLPGYEDALLPSDEAIFQRTGPALTKEEEEDRRRRVEGHAKRVREGHLPVLLSTSLRGPFTNWKNPWRTTALSISKVGLPTKKVRREKKTAARDGNAGASNAQSKLVFKDIVKPVRKESACKAAANHDTAAESVRLLQQSFTSKRKPAKSEWLKRIDEDLLPDPGNSSQARSTQEPALATPSKFVTYRRKRVSQISKDALPPIPASSPEPVEILVPKSSVPPIQPDAIFTPINVLPSSFAHFVPATDYHQTQKTSSGSSNMASAIVTNIPPTMPKPRNIHAETDAPIATCELNQVTKRKASFIDVDNQDTARKVPKTKAKSLKNNVLVKESCPRTTRRSLVSLLDERVQETPLGPPEQEAQQEHIPQTDHLEVTQDAIMDASAILIAQHGADNSKVIQDGIIHDDLPTDVAPANEAVIITPSTIKPSVQPVSPSTLKPTLRPVSHARTISTSVLRNVCTSLDIPTKRAPVSLGFVATSPIRPAVDTVDAESLLLVATSFHSDPGLPSLPDRQDSKAYSPLNLDFNTPAAMPPQSNPIPESLEPIPTACLVNREVSQPPSPAKRRQPPANINIKDPAPKRPQASKRASFAEWPVSKPENAPVSNENRDPSTDETVHSDKPTSSAQPRSILWKRPSLKQLHSLAQSNSQPSPSSVSEAYPVVSFIPSAAQSTAPESGMAGSELHASEYQEGQRLPNTADEVMNNEQVSETLDVFMDFLGGADYSF
ncbi:hypothetical protein BT63DRAFT_298057 [Microthyrium microscopicum]|uniref:Uncharacterized protein n=1 Tax=Microthyrium microscopicum TaxID=703497 RepID=A0A6A6U7V3_9PEZI|nr:hypothetical protein BT63DRAFT_298057 [Microthyrium microscopicum]